MTPASCVCQILIFEISFPIGQASRRENGEAGNPLPLYSVTIGSLRYHARISCTRDPCGSGINRVPPSSTAGVWSSVPSSVRQKMSESSPSVCNPSA